MPLFKIQTLHKVGHRISLSICLCFFLLSLFFQHGWTIKSYPTDQEKICVFCFVFFTWFPFYTHESRKNYAQLNIFVPVQSFFVFLFFPSPHGMYELCSTEEKKKSAFSFLPDFFSLLRCPTFQLFTATLLSHQTPLLSAGISIKSPSIWYLVILARVAIFFGTFSSSLPRWFCARPLWAKHGHILVGECGGVLAHRYVAACYMFRYMKMHPCLALVLGMFRTLLCILANTVCSSSSILYRRFMKMHRHSLWHPGLFAGCLYLAC